MILDDLADHARERVAAAKARLPLEDIKARARSLPRGGLPFEAALRAPGLSFICEIKKASPSKGVISPDFPYLDIARAYEAAGADCVSVLTEPKWFLGGDDIFRAVRGAISLPMLRKDFTVDEYQLYEAKILGADAVLLLCALLDQETIRAYLSICDGLGLTALVEAHDEGELAAAVAAGARVVGVNNRNLKDFTVDVGNSARLRAKIPPGVLFVAESGVSGPADAAAIGAMGADAALVGEHLMRAPDKKAALDGLRGAAR